MVKRLETLLEIKNQVAFQRKNSAYAEFFNSICGENVAYVVKIALIAAVRVLRCIFFCMKRFPYHRIVCR